VVILDFKFFEKADKTVSVQFHKSAAGEHGPVGGCWLVGNLVPWRSIVEELCMCVYVCVCVCV